MTARRRWPVRLRLIEPTSGESLRGRGIGALGRGDLRRAARMQITSRTSTPSSTENARRRDRRGALNPRHGARDGVAPRTRALGRWGGPDAAGRYPHEFSGGPGAHRNRPRSRAQSKLIVADEPYRPSTSRYSSDRHLLRTPEAARVDLPVHPQGWLRRHISTRVGVCTSPARRVGAERGLYANAMHQNTALISYHPRPRPGHRSERSGSREVPSGLAPGVPVRTRCPLDEPRCASGARARRARARSPCRVTRGADRESRRDL